MSFAVPARDVTVSGHILSVETNTFVESMKQNVEFKKSICGVHEIAQLTEE
jgi:hypothetical protein